MNDREQFEEAVCQIVPLPLFQRNEFGEYTEIMVQGFWSLWQAAVASKLAPSDLQQASSIDAAQADEPAYKAAYWFDCLIQCAKLLELDDETPIPSGVVDAVKALVATTQNGGKLAIGVLADNNGAHITAYHKYGEITTVLYSQRHPLGETLGTMTLPAIRQASTEPTKMTCAECKGTGETSINQAINWGEHRCAECSGKGFYWEPADTDMKHWFAFSFIGHTLEDGQQANASAYVGYEDQRITIERIKDAKRGALLHENAALISVSYLGHMARSEMIWEQQ